MKFDFNKFSNALGKGKEPATLTNCNTGTVYIYKCLIDDYTADRIDFSKFTLEQISDAMGLLQFGYSDTDQEYHYPDEHPYSISCALSSLETAIPSMFDELSTKRRRNIRKFI